MTAISPEAVIARSASIVASEVDGELLMMSVDQGRYFSLNDVAGEVWQRLAEPCTFAELVEAMTRVYDAPRDAIAADLQRLLAAMRERGVVELT